MAATTDTIVAPATPIGDGGVGIIRLSGAEAQNLLGKVFHPASAEHPLETHRLYYGRILNSSGEHLDEVMAVLMRGPRSYTREDVVEIHCHGGRVVMGRILDHLLELGARLAHPGEFTLRAFLNGRIDLAQAEAVIDLIHSRSQAAGNVALGQLEGRLSGEIHRLRESLADLLALVEAHIDFPEEEIGGEDYRRLRLHAGEVLQKIQVLLATFETGRLLREGLSVLILGQPNVGKSSLLNALLGEGRAIVTEEAGTTRDILEENLVLGGFPLRLVDTAGIRVAENAIEREGVRRAKAKAAAADLVLLVVDGARPLSDGDLLALEACEDKNILLVINKCDLGTLPLPNPFAELQQIRISAQKGIGLDELKEALVNLFSGGGGLESRESVLLSDRRHREALLRSRMALQGFFGALEEDQSFEFLAFELREALDALGEITGETAPDEILNRIFSRFCIGK